MRRLASGERFEIVKNAFDRPRLDRLIGPHAMGLAYQELRCLWTLQYAVA
jgi:hypothetical protein